MDENKLVGDTCLVVSQLPFEISSGHCLTSDLSTGYQGIRDSDSRVPQYLCTSGWVLKYPSTGVPDWYYQYAELPEYWYITRATF